MKETKRQQMKHDIEVANRLVTGLFDDPKGARQTFTFPITDYPGMIEVVTVAVIRPNFDETPTLFQYFQDGGEKKERDFLIEKLNTGLAHLADGDLLLDNLTEHIGVPARLYHLVTPHRPDLGYEVILGNEKIAVMVRRESMKKEMFDNGKSNKTVAGEEQ